MSEIVKLGDVCKFKRGLTYSKKDEVDYSKNIVVRATNINLENNKLNLSELKYIIESINIDENKILRKGDILICTASGSKSHLGKVALIDKDIKMAFGGFMGVLRTSKKCLPKFLYNILISQEFKKILLSNADGANINNLRFSQIESFEFILPPINEQQRIVAKLDAAFAEIDKTISLTKQKKIEEKNIKLSILKSIFSINNSQKTIGKIATVIAGQSPEGKYYNKTAEGIPFYQGKKEFGDYELKKPNVWTTKTTKVSLKGDVLLSVRAPVGETNINNEKICIGRGLAAIRANKECNSEFIYYFLNSIKDKIVGNTGAVFNSINKKQIEDIIIPAPSSDEQTQIVNKIKSIFSLMNEINLLTKQKLDNLNILKSSILKQELRNKAA